MIKFIAIQLNVFFWLGLGIYRSVLDSSDPLGHMDLIIANIWIATLFLYKD